MKKILCGIFVATMFFSPVNALAKEITIPEEVFAWVQSTPRGNYYFNHQQISYAVNEDKTIDLNILIVPTICTYDEIQIQDVQQKRRWRMLPTKGYNDLIGRADYLKFDLKNGTVQVTQRDDLDSTFATLDSDTTGEPINLSSLSKQEISYKFYKKIIDWAKDHNEMLIKRSRGKLSEEDSKLKPEEMPISKLDLSAETEEVEEENEKQDD
ncbi:MAG: hypothetical protein IK062_10000 [Selenomonadaceae bacterium]|nr:hypothetical protein [Selenomonadaceae bacterium]